MGGIALAGFVHLAFCQANLPSLGQETGSGSVAPIAATDLRQSRL